ncbi:hypothetical protein DFQ27_006637, partial [Actinomortierella ambigua]
MDVIALIIDNVDDRGTLFSLLVVNKDVFRYTCRVLYRDPFRFFRDYDPFDDDDELTHQSDLSLVQLLLALSPAVDDDSNVVRSILNVPEKRESESEALPTTMLNYLSFVRYVRLESSLDDLIGRSTDFGRQDCCPIHVPRDVFSVFKSGLAWSLCGHQLSQIRELEIQPESIDRYIAVASQLCRLSTVVITIYHDFSEELVKHAYSSTVRLIQSLQEHHGKDIVRDCSFYSLLGEDEDEVFRLDMDVLEYLPLHLPRDLNLTLPLRPKDLYLSRLTTLGVNKYHDRRWEDILKSYSDLTDGQTLQRCRALVDLSLEILMGEIEGPSVFAWAADEARERAAGRLLAPAVPLERLSISLKGPSPVDAHRVLMDCVRGFGGSLLSLMVFLDESQEGDAEEENKNLPLLSLSKDESTIMRRLQHLQITFSESEQLDRWLLPLCPNLKSLDVHFNDFMDPNTPRPMWSTFHFPNLTRLDLHQRAAFMFDPASFNDMLRLEDLRMVTISDKYSLSDRWTWDWNLPGLTRFSLHGTASDANFFWKVLRRCPKLELLFVCCGELEDESYLLNVVSELTSPAQDIFPSLKSLYFQGLICLQPKDLQALMGCALPGLQEFTLHNVDPCTVEQVVEFTRHHPSLKNVTLLDEPPNKALQRQLGLDTERHSSGEDTATSERCIYTFKSLEAPD